METGACELEGDDLNHEMLFAQMGPTITETDGIILPPMKLLTPFLHWPTRFEAFL